MTIDHIQAAVARRCGISVLELTSARRARKTARARHMAVWLCRQLTDESLTGIGRAFGDRDHSTVLHSIARTERAMAMEEMWGFTAKSLRAQLEGETP